MAYLYQHKNEPEAKRLLSKKFIAWKCVASNYWYYKDTDEKIYNYNKIPLNEQWELVKNFNKNWNENFLKNTDVSAKQKIFDYLRKERYYYLPDIANVKTVLIDFFKLEELINFFPRIAQETLLELDNSQVIELIDYFVKKQSISCDQIKKMLYVIFNRENIKTGTSSSGSLKPKEFLDFITLCSKNVEYGKSKIELLKIYRGKFEKWSNNDGNIPVLLEGINICDIDK